MMWCLRGGVGVVTGSGAGFGVRERNFMPAMRTNPLTLFIVINTINITRETLELTMTKPKTSSLAIKQLKRSDLVAQGGQAPDHREKSQSRRPPAA